MESFHVWARVHRPLLIAIKKEGLPSIQTNAPKGNDIDKTNNLKVMVEAIWDKFFIYNIRVMVVAKMNLVPPNIKFLCL